MAIKTVRWVLGIALLVPVASMGWQGVKSDRKQTTTVARQALAPDFTLPSTTGGTITLSDFRGKSNVLLYFMEGVGCDPCFQQSRDIQNEYDKFKAMDMELLTITVDPLDGLRKIARKLGITLPILADEDLKVSTMYDALKDSMHPGSRPGHTFVLVDKKGNVVWRKDYFIPDGSTKMVMDGVIMAMGKPGSVMHVPVEKLLADLKKGKK